MIALGDIVVIGGGCYGTFYAGQLETARAKGALSYRRLVLVDRDPACAVASRPVDSQRELVTADWDGFLDAWLDQSARDRDQRTDMIVPSPFMPHLLADWIARRARELWPGRDVALVPATTPIGTPYDRLHPDGVRYVSFADWLCPTHCVEPLTCPMTSAPRTWEMGEAVREWTATLSATRPTAGPALFTCRHVTYGVGMYPAQLAFDAIEMLHTVADTPGGGDLVIGSVSACHGAVAVLRVGGATGASSNGVNRER